MARIHGWFTRTKGKNSKRQSGARGYKIDKPVVVDVPPEGCQQVRGAFPTDDETIPPIPPDLPLYQHANWAYMWSLTPKQYVSPNSEELLPWDTCHNVLGARNGFPGTELYVPGCFGYDEQGCEWAGRPDIPNYSVRPMFDARENGMVDPNYNPKDWQWTSFEEEVPVFDAYTRAKPVKNQPLMLTISCEKPKCLDGESYQVAGPLGKPVGGVSNSTSLVPRTPKLPDSFSLAPQFVEWSEADKALSFMQDVEFKPAAEAQKTIVTAKIGRKVGFTDLPWEVRNQIYGYVVEDFTGKEFEISWCTKNKDLTHYIHLQSVACKASDLSWRGYRTDDLRFETMFTKAIKDEKATTQRRELVRKARSSDQTDSQATNSAGNGLAALLHVCRLTYNELCPILYGRNTFSFASRKLLRKFMDNLSPYAKGFIERIYLVYSQQGASQNPKLHFLKKKDQQLWIQVLKKVATECTSLRELNLTLQIRDSHIASNAFQTTWGEDLIEGLDDLRSMPSFKNLGLAVYLADDFGQWSTEADADAGDEEYGYVMDNLSKKQLFFTAEAVKERIMSAAKQEKIAIKIPEVAAIESRPGLASQHHMREENAKYLDESWRGKEGEWDGIVW